MTAPMSHESTDHESPAPWRQAAPSALPELAAWPSARRAEALARLDETGLPHDRLEDWRHTSLEDFSGRWTDYLSRDRAPAAPPGEVSRGNNDEPGSIHVHVVDGEVQTLPVATTATLSISSLRSLKGALPSGVAELIRKSGAVPPDRLADLNTALLSDVVVVSTAADAVIDTPVHLHLEGGEQPMLAQPRVLVDVANGSQLTLVIEHTGRAGTLANAVTEGWVGKGGRLTLIRIQALPDDGMLTETTRIELAESATAAITSVDLGGLLARQTLNVLLAGRDASSTIDGMFLADGRRHIDNVTSLEHRAPATTSRENFRGIADGEWHGVFNGKIIVQPGAAGSSAALTNRNLLLAKTAEIDTKPELEIHVDDVRCSHGATTGQLDANALFYLQSRGLDAAVARRVLMTAFLHESLAGITQPALRSRLEAQLDARLGASAGVSG